MASRPTSTTLPSIVCFGASAGGFEAYCTILSLLPTDTGFAFVIVHHQPATGKSLLVEILPGKTKMPVVLVADGETVKANHVYVVPAGRQITLERNSFRLSPLERSPGWPKNISVFLESLAAHRRKRAIAVILSGFDSDGAAALRSIKEAGGLVIAQKPQTAKEPSMPCSAVATGCVDQLLSPVEIAAELTRLGAERARAPRAKPTAQPSRP